MNLDVILDIAKLAIGLVVLILGGDFLVRGASRIALKLHISPLVVGLTIVAFGTSAPELLISLTSALAGSPDLAMGNVVGSNICNLALVLGLTAIISSISIPRNSLSTDWPMTMGSSVLLFYFCWNDLWLKWHEGVIFIAALIVYLIWTLWKSRKEKLEVIESELDIPVTEITDTRGKMWKDLMWIALGCVGLYFGSEWFVGGAQDLARQLGVTERIIGVTVLAIGTSLPELVTSMVAAFKKETDMALGNLLGSNIFNVLSILGFTSIVQEIAINEQILQGDMLWMLAITLLILPFMLIQKKISRFGGTTLLLLYGYYIYTVIA
jgi:cation:H+ antiporter